MNKKADIFKENAKLLHAKRLSFAPLIGKRPVVNQWSKYSKEAISDMVFESWSQQYPQLNIGLVTGEQSGIVAVDYDAVSDHPEISSIIPKSSVERFGKKGWVRFFKFNGEPSRKFNNIQRCCCIFI